MSIKDFYVLLLEKAGDHAVFIEMKALKGGGVSFWIYDQLGFKMLTKKTGQHIVIPTDVAEDMNFDKYDYKRMKDGDVHIRVNEYEVAEELRDEILIGIMDSLKESVAVEPFGCCNSFIQCSDQLECLHKGKKSYLGCHYRKNLESGRIFYGKNKNI